MDRLGLNFRFDKATVVDKAIAFARASIATRISKSTGLVETVAANVPRLCGRQELWKAGSNTLFPYSNDMISGYGWGSSNVSVVKSGLVNLLSVTGSWYIYKYITIVSGQQYTASCTVRCPAGNIAAVFRASRDTTGAYTSNAFTATTTPQRISVTFTSLGTDSISYITFDGGVAGSLEISDIQLETGSSATAYEPNPIVIQPGLLMEGQNTNYVLRSVPDGTWALATGVATAGAYLTAPDGTATAMPVQYNGSGPAGSYRYYCGVSDGSASSKRVSSIWLRSVSGATTLRISDNQGATSVVRLSTEWRRFYLPSYSAGTPGSWLLLVYSDSGDNSAFSIGVWGAQQEPGTFPSSYIPTAGASVTRSADNAYYDVSKIWNPSEGAIVCEADFGPASGVYNTAFETTNSAVDMYRNASSVLVGKSGYINFGTRTGRVRGAFTYSQRLTKGTVNGESILQAAQQVGVPTNIFLGSNAGFGEPLNGTIQRLSYYPHTTDDITLQVSSELK